MADQKVAYQELLTIERTVGLWASIDSVLGWDESTYLPEKGVKLRGDQKALLHSTLHQKMTEPRVGELLRTVEESTLVQEPMVAANVREIRRNYDRATKIPGALVNELALASTAGREAWIDARKRSDFSRFKPFLEKVLQLRKAECRYLGFEKEPYDALLENYEPGAKTKKVAGILSALKTEMVPLIDRVKRSSRSSSLEFLKGNYPEAAQYGFGKQAVARIGFDFTRGRIDTTTHPFCSGFSPCDVRITTRYDSAFFPSSFYSLLHEAGHGLYEQGLNEDYFGEPLGRACSTAIHESQSRLWENLVGRRPSFWSYFYPQAQATFCALESVSQEEFVRAVNHVELSTIRVEADEMTYNLHIILRFELEQALVNGDIKVADVPAAWNEKFRSLFGFAPSDDAEGCLQDVHWSGGDFGYFPTYALGNMYAAQFYEAAEKELGDLDAQFKNGHFSNLREWLGSKIHTHGQLYTAEVLCRNITGKELSHEALVRHLTKKCEVFYGI